MGWNLDFLLITPQSISRTHFETMTAILDVSKQLCISHLRSYRTETRKLSIIPQNILFWPILTHNWVCLVKQLLLLKRELKVPEGTPIPPQDLEGRVRSTPHFYNYMIHSPYDKSSMYNILFIVHYLYKTFCILYILYILYSVLYSKFYCML